MVAIKVLMYIKFTKTLLGIIYVIIKHVANLKIQFMTVIIKSYTFYLGYINHFELSNTVLQSEFRTATFLQGDVKNLNAKKKNCCTFSSNNVSTSNILTLLQPIMRKVTSKMIQ